MRERKFRGKRVDNGKGVKGYYKYHPYHDIHIILVFEEHDRLESGGIWREFEVIPETVEQYIGLHDKNGKEIYEGDIVKSTSKDLFVIDWQTIFARFVMTLTTKVSYRIGIIDIDLASCEVIGNIHENPELLAEKP